MSVYLKGGKVLLVDGKVATDAACCCDCAPFSTVTIAVRAWGSYADHSTGHDYDFTWDFTKTQTWIKVATSTFTDRADFVPDGVRGGCCSITSADMADGVASGASSRNTFNFIDTTHTLADFNCDSDCVTDCHERYPGGGSDLTACLAACDTNHGSGVQLSGGIEFADLDCIGSRGAFYMSAIVAVCGLPAAVFTAAGGTIDDTFYADEGGGTGTSTQSYSTAFVSVTSNFSVTVTFA